MLLNCHFIYRITKKLPFFQRFRIAKNISALKLNCYLCDALDIQNKSIGTSTDICLSAVPLIFVIYIFIIYDGILLKHECSCIHVSIVCILHAATDHVIRQRNADWLDLIPPRAYGSTLYFSLIPQNFREILSGDVRPHSNEKFNLLVRYSYQNHAE